MAERGADQKCKDAADAGIPALQGKNWMAWISDTTTGPASRFTTQADVPYRRPDNAQIAPNWAGLIDGSLDSQMRVSELNTDLGTGKPVWTNTSTAGTPLNSSGDPALDNCENWTVTTGSGNTGGTEQNTTWTERGSAGCSGGRRLHCFQQD